MFEHDDSEARRCLEEQVNASMRRGFAVWIAAWVPLVLLVAGLCLTSGHSALRVVLGFAVWGLLHSLAGYRLGQQGKATGRAVTLLVAPLFFFPSLAAVAIHLVVPGGTASFVNGPLSFILFALVVLTGFAFDGRLAVLVGIGTGAGYFLMYLLARDQLALLRSGEPTVARLIASPFAYVVKSALLVIAGALVGMLSATTKRLILRVSREEQEKSYIRNTFGRIVDHRVRDLMVQGRIELGGETRVNTVLFSDIRGFSTFAERMSPKDLFHFMRGYFDLVSAPIRGQDGTIVEYVGDEVMALFGAPLPVSDHAARALRAAWLLQKAVEAQRPAWENEGKPAVRSGVGIHTGPMLVGNIGSSDRYKYGALGDNVNLGSRLQGLTKEYGVPIIASEHTVRAAEGSFHVRELDRVRVRGRETEVRIYEVMGPAAEELAPPVRELVSEYDAALRLHRDGDARGAAQRLGRCLDLVPGDGPSKRLLAKLEDAPPRGRPSS